MLVYSHINIFHGTLKPWAEKIIESGFRDNRCKNTDDHWLGHGTYFFLHHDEAAEWAKSKATKFCTEYSIIIADVNKINITDLDLAQKYNEFIKFAHNFDQLLMEEGIILDYTKGLNRESKDFEIKLIKRKRCCIFDFYVKQYNIRAIKYTFNLSKQFSTNSNADFLLGKNQTQICIYDKTILENIRLASNLFKEDYI